MNLNSVQLIGRVTKNLELKTANGKTFLPFTLAVGGYKSKTGEEHTDFINCLISGTGAEVIAKYVRKGDKMRVSGRLTISRSQGKDGKNFTNTFVQVTEFEFLETSGRKDSNISKTEEPKFDKVVEPANAFENVELSDEDLPF